ncbi:MAG TPA: S9 family peptidase [Candidatus Mcinerneyibacteriales bacterium]|nr:S9 family peptidase [Candidatus Mcinerneyibacteriales bacterium]HPJ70046.1 S9 family peptidase [Candidatus Mcinerneyibacteriales bacterium]HPQ89343.1 S9 family peptidase [Candidatus Mcinerneyibacteriales bacterium]
MKKGFVFPVALIFCVLIPGCLGISTPEPVPPAAPRYPHITEVHGISLTDDYYWMRERENPQVMAYIEEENAYTREAMNGTEGLQKRLYREMVSRIRENDRDVPEQEGNYEYYTKTERGKEYPLYCRKKLDPGAAEEVILDVNTLAKGYDYFSIGLIRISPDEEKLAYTYDTTGAEEYRLAIKDLSSGSLLEERSFPTPDFEWMSDNKTYLYTVEDEAWRPYRVYRHTMGSVGEDELLYEEKDGRYWMWLSASADKSYLFVGLGSKTTSEIYFLKSEDVQARLTCFAPRRQGVEYYLNARDGYFYTFTNEGAPGFKLERVPAARFDQPAARETVVAPSSDTLTDYYLFEDYLALFLRHEGIPGIRIKDLKTGDEHSVELPDPVMSIWSGKNKNYKSRLLRFSCSSLVTPASVYDYDMEKRESFLLKRSEVKGYSKDEYVMERVEAPSHDGTLVPIILSYKKGFPEGPRPLYLYGYGAYGDNNDPYFSSARLSLLNRGFIFAMVQVRGGGEMGISWYEAGKLMNKKNTFYDTIACAEHLIREGYTEQDKIVLSGGSAGGLLVGAVVNMHPSLFEAVVASVPFVDVINTMLDPTIPLTVGEYEEWGDPMQKDYFDYMLSYSPYDNIQETEYPHMLITGGLNDPRVQYWEPLKWTARLRKETTGDKLLLLRMNTDSGHMGSSGRYSWFRELAFEYAFILHALGMDR